MNESETDTAQAAVRADARPWFLFATPLATRPWLIRLRWTTAAIEAGVALVAWSFPDLELPLRRIALLVAAASASNAAAAIWLSREGALPRPAAAIGLALDTILLAALLELTGGPFNPFVVVFAVQVALAALTLGAAYAWSIAACASVCYGLLIYWHLHELEPGHHRVNDFPTHLFAMWIFLTASAELAAFFVSQAAHALADREVELETARARAARSERLASLTTLAAGAAHELSTPLATIALASRELQHAIERDGRSPGLGADARLIRGEVDRCRAILDQMSGRAGGTAEDRVEAVQLDAVLNGIRAGLPKDLAARVQVEVSSALEPVRLPLAGLRQALLTLIRNACEASSDEVVVRIVQKSDRLRLTVTDHGPRLSSDVLERAGEPFFTTKEPGRGMGLGLFLARAFAERVGGSLTLHSDAGTIASLDLPVRREPGAA